MAARSIVIAQARNTAGIFTAIAALCLPLPSGAETEVTDTDYLQVITDVTASTEQGYRSEFGYAVLVVMDGVRLLFDTGVTAGVLQHNLRQAGVDAADLDFVVLSHNHPDHIGGLAYIRRAAPAVPVLAPPKQGIDGGPVERINGVRRLADHLYVLRTHTDEPTVGISDELSLVALTDEGPYLVTACSHTGLASIVEATTRLTGQAVYFQTGGARLKFRQREDTAAVARRLDALGVRRISPGHCSVDHAVTRVLEENFSGQLELSEVGRRVPLRVSR